MSRIVVLDSGPLGMVTTPKAASPIYIDRIRNLLVPNFKYNFKLFYSSFLKTTINRSTINYQLSTLNSQLFLLPSAFCYTSNYSYFYRHS
ncbi:MAG: hypothetical protein ACRC62_04520 [Microcoleus sp.]